MVFLVLLSFSNTNINLIVSHSNCQGSSLFCKESGKWCDYNCYTIQKLRKLKHKAKKKLSSLNLHLTMGSEKH